jgi:hypothetical protein
MEPGFDPSKFDFKGWEYNYLLLLNKGVAGLIKQSGTQSAPHLISPCPHKKRKPRTSRKTL